MESDTNDKAPNSELCALTKYNKLDSPNSHIIKRSILIAIPLSLVYILFSFVLPSNTNTFYPLFNVIFENIDTYQSWVKSNLIVSEEIRFNRLVLIWYLSLYFGMWWVYFSSKASQINSIEAKRLKIQSLRRLLGTTSVFFKVVVAFFNQAASFTSSFSGFSVTAPTGAQSRVFPDHRAGFFDLAKA